MAKRRIYKRDRNGRFARTGNAGMTTRPIARKRPLSKDIKFEASISAVAAVTAGQSAFAYGSGAIGAAALRQKPLAAALGAKAAVQGGIALNEVHRVRTVTSKRYVNGNVNERSKFDTSYRSRARQLNRADTAAEVIAVAATGITAAGPLIKQRANAKRAQRRNSDKNGVAGMRVIPNWEPKVAKKKRSGVYDITTANGRRVA